MVKRFARRLVTHLKAVWPAECAELGDSALDEIVNNATKRAASFGLSAEYDIVRYMDLTFLLGKDFETNPLAAWTRPILGDPSLAPAAKMDRVYERMELKLAAIEKRKRGKPAP